MQVFESVANVDTLAYVVLEHVVRCRQRAVLVISIVPGAYPLESLGNPPAYSTPLFDFYISKKFPIDYRFIVSSADANV